MESEDDKAAMDAAATLILFSLSSPDRSLRPLDQHHLEAISSSLLPWGTQSARSRCSCGGKRKQEEEDEVSAVACRRPSPATPLDYGAVPSTSGSDGTPHSSEFKVGAVGRASILGVSIASSKSIRRPGRKKTITELQALERSLMEEKANLKKIVESKLKEMVALMTENQRLMDKKSILRQTSPAAEAAKPLFLLPDLNEPAMET
ncbi:hypothetical protein AXF42_Ash020095 [Apostasia shenzhenica]|uniref:Uncharacterized protein n=1 Tax=Apostasia shenzhenica TaxID=1088818 RepID=A0A2I0APS5_9ASPA|nr:hypothetical protein AXF42_Ash020095 [Apostasia shenzhenica]